MGPTVTAADTHGENAYQGSQDSREQFANVDNANNALDAGAEASPQTVGRPVQGAGSFLFGEATRDLWNDVPDGDDEEGLSSVTAFNFQKRVGEVRETCSSSWFCFGIP